MSNEVLGGYREGRRLAAAGVRGGSDDGLAGHELDPARRRAQLTCAPVRPPGRGCSHVAKSLGGNADGPTLSDSARQKVRSGGFYSGGPGAS